MWALFGAKIDIILSLADCYTFNKFLFQKYGNMTTRAMKQAGDLMTFFYK